MKSIRQIFSQKKVFSFEIFPPKNSDAEIQLFKNLEILKNLAPDFISVTMGAMGSNQRNTFDIVQRIQDDYGVTGVAHLTCIGSNRKLMKAVLKDLQSKNISHLLCLRGDQPKDESYQKPQDGFSYANELIDFVRQECSEHFTLGAAAYPESHIESPSKQADLIYLKQKVDAGADFLITQLFFNNDEYFSFVDRARKIGIKVPILPGIMPVTNFAQLKTFTQMCGSKIPDKMYQDLSKIKESPNQVRRYGVEYAIEQCQNLIERGAPGLHFYILNQTSSIQKIYEALHKSK